MTVDEKKRLFDEVKKLRSFLYSIEEACLELQNKLGSLMDVIVYDHKEEEGAHDGEL